MNNPNTDYWGEIPRSLMQDINKASRQIGWREALNRLLRPSYPTVHRYVVDEQRADWRFFLPLSKESIVLDVGSGWGTLASALAPFSKSVIALERVSERVEFINTRALQSGFNNISPIQADFIDMPFADRSFDLVVANGVLEWVPLGQKTSDPNLVQRNFLMQVRRMLRPGGWIYVGIENRFGLNLILGGKDHTGLPFTSLLPRYLATLILKATQNRHYLTSVKHESYRTYTYHASGYRELFRQAGFQKVDIYWTIPGYNHPLTMGNFNDSYSYETFVLNYFTPSSKVVKTGLYVASLLRLTKRMMNLVPAFAIYAQT